MQYTLSSWEQSDDLILRLLEDTEDGHRGEDPDAGDAIGLSKILKRKLRQSTAS